MARHRQRRHLFEEARAVIQLVGVNRSPFTRRVAITLQVYGIPYQQQPLSGFGNRADVRVSNPLGRIPALILDDGETLVDSAAIIDHLDEMYGRDRALIPSAGADRRSVLRITALMMGACDKGLAAAYERNHHPAEKVHPARSAAKRAFALWYDALIHLWRAHGVGLPRQMIPAEFESALEAGYVVAGSPATVRNRLRRDNDTAGINYCLFRLAFGDLSFEESARSVELLVKEVMPALEAGS
jgi:hypothetical protein